MKVTMRITCSKHVTLHRPVSHCVRDQNDGQTINTKETMVSVAMWKYIYSEAHISFMGRGTNEEAYSSVAFTCTEVSLETLAHAWSTCTHLHTCTCSYGYKDITHIWRKHEPSKGRFEHAEVYAVTVYAEGWRLSLFTQRTVNTLQTQFFYEHIVNERMLWKLPHLVVCVWRKL